MSNSIWKLATIGLAGYVIGREKGLRPVAPEYDKAQEKSSFIENLINLKNNCEDWNTNQKLRELKKKYVDSITFDSKESAWNILDLLSHGIEHKGYTTLKYFMMLTYAVNDHFNDLNLDIFAKYGWTNLDAAQPLMNVDGRWMLVMPKLEKLQENPTNIRDYEEDEL